MMQIIEGFQNPPGICRGTDLWMLNDRLDPAELDRQIMEMKEKGFYSFIARTYVGLKSDYPGPEWKKNVHTIVDSAKRHDMRVYLQAGYMPGSVYGLPPEYALGAIKVFDKDAAHEQGRMLCSHDGKDYVLTRLGVFLDLFNVEAAQYYVKQSYEDMWRGFEAEYGKTIVSVWVDEPYYHNAYLPWTRDLESIFTARWGYSLEEKVYLLYVDEPGCEQVRYHYRTLMTDLMQRAYFTQVRDWCNANGLWFSGHLMAEDNMESQISRTMACMPLYKYFDIPGIDLLFADLPWRDNPIPDNKPSPEFRNALYNTPLQCTSASHQAGKTQILAEIYGCVSHNLNFRDQKHMFDQYAAFGINHKMAHAVFYALRGRAKRAYPPHINYYQPYWPQYRHVTDYCARASFFISQGRPVKDVLVMHPLGSAFLEYRGNLDGREQSEALRLRDRAFTRLLVDLLADQCAFELGDEESFADMGEALPDGRIRFGCMEYKTIVLPHMRVIKRTTLELLRRFDALGGVIHVLGDVPALVDGWQDPAAREAFAAMRHVVYVDRTAPLLRSLRAYRTIELTGEDGLDDVVVNHRAGEGVHYFFLYNRNLARPFQGTLRVTGEYGAKVWRGEDGQVLPWQAAAQAGMTRTPIRMEAGGSLMLTLEAGAQAQAEPETAPLTRGVSIQGPWRVARGDNPNVLVLEFCQYQKGAGEWSALYPIMAVHDKLIKEDYRGKLSLRFSFVTDIALKGLRLALENPLERRIFLNGVPVDVPSRRAYYLDKSFECVPLPDAALRLGENEIVIALDYIPLEQPKAEAAFSLFHDFKGLELECAYLLGDFAVDAVREPTRATGIRLDREFVLTAERGQAYRELTDAGYPFYAGVFQLAQCFELPADADLEGAKLRLDGFRGTVARVFINGKHAGEVCWAPYTLPVGGLLRPGKNEVVVELYNSLRNVLGPYHRPKGEYGKCFTSYNLPNLAWIGAVDDNTGAYIADWADRRAVDSGGWTDAYMLVSQGLDGMTLLMR